MLNIINNSRPINPCQWTVYSHHRRKPVNPETSHLSHRENQTISLHTKHNKKALVKKMRKKKCSSGKKALIETTKEKKTLYFFLRLSTGVILLDNGSHLGWKTFSCRFYYPGLDIWNMYQAKGCLKQFSIANRETQKKNQEKLRGSHQL